MTTYIATCRKCEEEIVRGSILGTVKLFRMAQHSRYQHCEHPEMATKLVPQAGEILRHYNVRDTADAITPTEVGAESCGDGPVIRLSNAVRVF
jgi:hypothetical protein